MDQQLFNLARPLAMNDLVQMEPADPPAAEPGESPSDHEKRVAEWEKTRAEELGAKRKEYGGYATSIFLIGWATGGLIFGVLGDRWGRVKTMLLTIIVYSIFTGISAFSRGFADFCVWRFLTGLGVGGEFAVGVSLVAEIMPNRARPHALGLLQALSAVGNITAALIGMAGTSWQTMFLIGTAPALLSLVVRRRLKEPERWQSASAADGVKQQLGSYSELFGNPELRYRALIGLLLASAGVIGLWGIGFFTPDLQREVFRPVFEAEGLDKPAVEAALKKWSGITSLVLNLGAFFGIYMFSHLSHHLGRRLTFAICFFGAMLATANVFWNLGKFNGVYDILWMVPIMGFFQLSIFGGYAVYFPELFPTRLRSTGTSFCYNVGRFVAALGPFTLGKLIRSVYTGPGYVGADSFRYAGVTMCCIFMIGIIAIPFAPETKGKPLPE
ncbi:MAG: MFS transporter [Planctomyces sp.]|nr:MFS transporter [Planctomyces sp.]